MSFPIRMVVAAVFSGFLPMSVHAAGHETCIVYSNEAGRQAQEAIRLRCGFSGPVWSIDTLAHMRWCEGANDVSVAHERGERFNALRNCGACRDYATEAQQAAKTNEQLGCGFSGPRWQTNADNHFRWCLGLNPASTQPASPAWKERDARNAELANCRREFPKERIPPPKATSCPENMFLGKDGTCYPILR